MTDETGKTEMATEPANSRRSVLKLGAVAVPAIATLSPSMAMATGTGANISLATCTVPMNDLWYDEHGRAVPAGVKIESGADGKRYFLDGETKVWVFAPPPNNEYTGQQLKDAFPRGLSGGYELPSGVHDDQFRAHVGYLQNIHHNGGAGITCLMSLTGA